MAAKTKAEQIIQDNPVAVFSKSYCPYCKATKSLLSEMGAKPYIVSGIHFCRRDEEMKER